VTTADFTGSTATFNLNGIVGPNNGTSTYQVVATFSSSATTGNYQFSITAGTGTNGQAVQFGNLPVQGAIVQIVSATATWTSTETATLTPSSTPTVQATLTPTSTATNAFSATSTPAGNQDVVVYPNPVTGPTVNVLSPAYSGVSNVEVELFTTAFRRVQDEVFSDIHSGTAVKVNLTDEWGHPLADGLYYVVVIVDGKRSIGKLLVLR